MTKAITNLLRKSKILVFAAMMPISVQCFSQTVSLPVGPWLGTWDCGRDVMYIKIVKTTPTDVFVSFCDKNVYQRGSSKTCTNAPWGHFKLFNHNTICGGGSVPVVTEADGTTIAQSSEPCPIALLTSGATPNSMTSVVLTAGGYENRTCSRVEHSPDFVLQ